uniref:Gap junction beta-6 protein n=1 Tax=Phallusia mammillata TaxID=59560 RepID=A0A6F9DE83_9ASCI|nr:gap junction beta-6 protein [Phallusia mammillata]
MTWNVVQKLVEGVGVHSSLIGKFWINSFLLLRFLLVVSIAKNSFGDGKFVCNTLSPGCNNVCLNEFTPIVPVRYWFFQILGVSLMSIIFNIYTTHKLALITKAIKRKRDFEAKEEKTLNEKLKRLKSGDDAAKDDKPEKKAEEKKEDKKDPEVVATKLDGEQPSKLYVAYFFMVLLRMLVEIGFMVGQYFVYTFKFVVPELWRCQHWPCPNVVDCFIDRPKEKTIMICIFYCTGCVMIILSVMELYTLAGNLPKAWKNRKYDVTKEVFGEEGGPMFDGAAGGVHYWAGVDGVYEMSPQGYPDVAGIPTLVSRRNMPPNRNRMRKKYRY